MFYFGKVYADIIRNSGCKEVRSGGIHYLLTIYMQRRMFSKQNGSVTSLFEWNTKSYIEPRLAKCNENATIFNVDEGGRTYNSSARRGCLMRTSLDSNNQEVQRVMDGFWPDQFGMMCAKLPRIGLGSLRACRSDRPTPQNGRTPLA